MSKAKRILLDRESKELLKRAYLNYLKKIEEKAHHDPSAKDMKATVRSVMASHVNEFIEKAISNIEKEEGAPLSEKEREECKSLIGDFLSQIERGQ